MKLAFFHQVFTLHAGKTVIACMLTMTLTGCLGAPIAQQVASSLLMRAADKATSNAYDAYLLRDTTGNNQPQQHDVIATIPGHNIPQAAVVVQSPKMDEYWTAFLNAGFTEIQPIHESLPTTPSAQADANTQPQAMEASELIAVETWNLLLGEEKQRLMEKARLRGSHLPDAQEWSSWQLAVGASKASPATPVTFLVPPELGRINSGQELLVEVVGQGDLSIARYRIQSQPTFQQASKQP